MSVIRLPDGRKVVKIDYMGQSGSFSPVSLESGDAARRTTGGLQEAVKRFAKNLVFPITRIKPSLLIVGTQKAGTTTLYEYLTTHPRILPNRSWKEVRFFDIPEHYHKGIGSYLRSFPTRLEARGRISLDASPGYLFFPEVPHRIRKDLGADIRMIAVLREPAARAYSAWKMYHSWATHADVADVNRKIADRRSFAEAVDDELNGRVPADMYPYAYVARGLYADQIENYCRVFDRKNLVLFDFRRLKNDLSGLLDEVTQFLDLPPFTTAQKAKLGEVRYNKGLSRETSPQDQETLETLREFYRPHNARLERLVGWSIDS